MKKTKYRIYQKSIYNFSIQEYSEGGIWGSPGWKDTYWEYQTLELDEKRLDYLIQIISFKPKVIKEVEV